jgi:hypothetical protein
MTGFARGGRHCYDFVSTPYVVPCMDDLKLRRHEESINDIDESDTVFVARVT